MKNPGIFATGCAAINCHIIKGKHSCGFFPFPSDEDRCKLWVIRCRRLDLFAVPPSVLAKYYSLCEKHFDFSLCDDSIKNNLDVNAMPLPNLFDFPLIRYEIPVDNTDPSVKEGAIFPGNLDLKSLNRIVAMSDGKLFICGGPLLSPKHLYCCPDFNVLLHVEEESNQLEIPYYSLAFVGIIQTVKLGHGFLKSISLFNVCQAYTLSGRSKTKSSDSFVDTLDNCEEYAMCTDTKSKSVPFAYTNLCYIESMLDEGKHLQLSLLKFSDRQTEEHRNKYVTYAPISNPLPLPQLTFETGHTKTVPSILKHNRQRTKPVYESRFDVSHESMALQTVPVSCPEGSDTTSETLLPIRVEIGKTLDIDLKNKKFNFKPPNVKKNSEAPHAAPKRLLLKSCIERRSNKRDALSNNLRSKTNEDSFLNPLKNIHRKNIKNSDSVPKVSSDASFKSPRGHIEDISDTLAQPSSSKGKEICSPQASIKTTRGNRSRKKQIGVSEIPVQKFYTPESFGMKTSSNPFRRRARRKKCAKEAPEPSCNKTLKSLNSSNHRNPELFLHKALGNGTSGMTDPNTLKDPLQESQDTETRGNKPGKNPSITNVKLLVESKTKLKRTSKIQLKNFNVSESSLKPDDKNSTDITEADDLRKCFVGKISPETSAKNTSKCPKKPAISKLKHLAQQKSTPSNKNIWKAVDKEKQDGCHPLLFSLTETGCVIQNSAETLNCLNSNRKDNRLRAGSIRPVPENLLKTYCRPKCFDKVLGEKVKILYKENFKYSSTDMNSTSDNEKGFNENDTLADSTSLEDLEYLNEEFIDEYQNDEPATEIVISDNDCFVEEISYGNKTEVDKNEPHAIPSFRTVNDENCEPSGDTESTFKDLDSSDKVSSGTSNWIVNSISEGIQTSNVDEAQSSETNHPRKKNKTLNNIFKVVNKMPITDKLKNQLKFAIFDNCCSSSIMAKRKLVKIPICKKSGAITSEYVTKYLSHALGKNTKVMSSSSGLSRLSLFEREESTSSSFSVGKGIDRAGSTAVLESQTSHDNASRARSIHKDYISDDNETLVSNDNSDNRELVIQDESDTGKDSVVESSDTVITCDEPIPGNISEIIRKLLPSQQVKVHKERVFSTDSNVTFDKSFYITPNKDVISSDSSVKLSEIPIDHKLIPRHIKDIIRGSEKTVNRVLLIEERRKKKKSSRSSSNTYKVPKSIDYEPNKVPNNDLKINYKLKQQTSDELLKLVTDVDDDAFFNDDSNIEIQEDLDLDPDDPDPKHETNCTISHSLTSFNEKLRQHIYSSDSSISVPHTLVCDPIFVYDENMQQVSVTDETLPDNLKQIAEDLNPNAVKVMFINENTGVTPEDKANKNLLPDHIKDIIESMAPQSGKIVILKNNDSGSEKSSVVPATKIYTSPKKDVNLNGKVVDFEQNFMPKPKSLDFDMTLPPRIMIPHSSSNGKLQAFPSNYKLRPCYCNGKQFPLEFSSRLNKKVIESMPETYRSLAYKFLSLKMEIRKLKKACNRYKLVKEKLQKYPRKVKFGEVLSELKAILKPETYQFILATLHISHKGIHGRGRRYSEELKRICCKIVLSGGWKLYLYLRTLLYLPNSKTLFRFINKQMELVRTAEATQQDVDVIAVPSTSSEFQSTDSTSGFLPVDLEMIAAPSNIPCTDTQQVVTPMSLMDVQSLNCKSASTEQKILLHPSLTSVQNVNFEIMENIAFEITEPSVPTSPDVESSKNELEHAIDILSFGPLENFFSSKVKTKTQETQKRTCVKKKSDEIKPKINKHKNVNVRKSNFNKSKNSSIERSSYVHNYSKKLPSRSKIGDKAEHLETNKSYILNESVNQKSFQDVFTDWMRQINRKVEQSPSDVAELNAFGQTELVTPDPTIIKQCEIVDSYNDQTTNAVAFVQESYMYPEEHEMETVTHSEEQSDFTDEEYDLNDKEDVEPSPDDTCYSDEDSNDNDDDDDDDGSGFVELDEVASHIEI